MKIETEKKNESENENYFKPENAVIDKTTGCLRMTKHLSPSGKYELVIVPYTTKPGCWSHTKGSVYSTADNKLIAEIKRNYSSFPFLFIENHVNGNDYLVGGEDYQGSTIIELTTGNRRNFLPEEAKNGCGFCWVEYKYDETNKMLIVNGCYWACPYEYRFYNFSDPMNGWPEIKVDPEMIIDDDDKWPEINGKIIKCFQTRYEDTDEYDDIEVDKRELDAISTFELKDGMLVLIEEWVSDKEKEIRSAREEANRKYEEWLNNFRANDPLYLERNKLLKDPIWKPSDYDSIGITHSSWCPDFKGNERRMCKRILERKKDDVNGYTVDIEWAVETGPIKLTIYKGGDKMEDKFFEHSIAGMNEAFAYARAVICTV